MPIRFKLDENLPRNAAVLDRQAGHDVHTVLAEQLARIIHDRFCSNRRSAAATSLRPTGSPLGPSTYCTSTPRALTAPRAGFATRLDDFATNRHE
ncbi:hypothetical protein NSPZN2_20010 [Nitrospira defluvii]|uniref:DUF5615 domain-containing protein n=1 Tax=Nitrospira defluvii TaxID=330214 RepID=A0ABM8RCS6_9BACT|nr:hypothetical protein NSPZN2_20010 [Nitrospira defluvii]